MSKPRTGAPKRVAVGLLAGALAMFGVALAPPAGAAASVTTDRLAGATRYGTAEAIATSSTFSAPTTAIVATGENFPDALAASTLAGANAQAPIILTQTGTYTADAKAALASLKGKGVNAVTIVGGTSAVSADVETAIKGDGFTVTRVAGDDRYETAAAIATAANTKSAPAAIGGLKTALIATGTNYPDALAGGPGAYANKLPLLLVSDTVPAETSNAISTLGIKKVLILGGTAAVSATVEAQLVAATGNPVTRLAGANRFSTATAVADYEKNTLAFPVTSAVLATGVNFPDALAAGPLGGQNKAPIILTASLPAESAAWLDANSSTLNRLFVSGGTAAIDDATVAAAKTAAQNTSNDSAGSALTTRPELTGAAVVETVAALNGTPAKPAGTYIRYTFDETLNTAFAPTAGLFHVYDSSYGPASSQIVNSATSATIETTAPATGTSVLAYFSGLTSATAAATLTKATVEFNAVRDGSGAENPEGDAPVGTGGTTANPAGATSAPDLVSVGNFRQGQLTGQTAVDFTFDQAAFVATTTGFSLIDVNNLSHGCDGPARNSSATTLPSGGTVAGGNGTTTITVICTNIGGTVPTVAGTAYSTGNVARGFVVLGTVTANSTDGPLANPSQAADVAINSTGPDLTSVSVTASSTGGTDTAVFTFDLPISSATGSLFKVYSASGIESTGSAPVINSASPNQVAVTIPANTAISAVGGSVIGDGTVQNSAVTSTGGLSNQRDEEGLTNAATSVTRTPGKVSGPDLVSVTLANVADAFGTPSSVSATYVFDVAIGTTVANSFFLYFADGTRFKAGSCTISTTTTTSVACSGFTNATSGATPTGVTLGGAVVGTVARTAVTSTAATGSQVSTEDAQATTGGTGTPAS